MSLGDSHPSRRVNDGGQGRPRSWHAHFTLIAFLFLLPLVALPGCSGCGGDPAAKKKALDARKRLEEAKKKKKKPKDDLQIGRLVVQPNEYTLFQRAKPGHWVSVSQLMRANNKDFQGEVEWTAVDSEGRPLNLPGKPYRMAASRPVALAKDAKRFKQIDMTLFVPPSGDSARYRSELRHRGGGGAIRGTPRSFQRMRAHEYHFVVLAQEPAAYRRLKNIDSVMLPKFDFKTHYYYRVSLPSAKRRPPLPENPLTWTGIAYVLWDDYDPTRLTAGQKRAMIDWLHFGGQLLVSGPESLDALRGEFLKPYLPVAGGKTIRLTAADLKSLSDKWTLPVRDRPGRPLSPVTPFSAVELSLNKPDSRILERISGTDLESRPLVVERRVGRGRIVVTAFRLKEKDLLDWPGFDGFLNGCLLRRGPRKFSSDAELEEAINNPSDVIIDWVEAPGHRLDPTYVTTYRLFSRDAGFRYQRPRQEQKFDQFGNPIFDPGAINEDLPTPTKEGLGAWNDYAGVSTAARTTLSDAAGIEIPNGIFVLLMLSAYLAVLVPVNWTVFHLLGRVEWAWIAAPIIAVAGAVAVIRSAQLDIGFARSRTEVAVVEMQGGYPRAHVTRYVSLYTSLSTGYELEFDDRHALVQPFARSSTFDARPSGAPTTVTYHRGKTAHLSGFHVRSNYANALHTEQVLDLGGAITLMDATAFRPSVKNETPYELSAAAVLRRGRRNKLEVAWVGNLRAGGTAVLEFEKLSPQKLKEKWKPSAAGAESGKTGVLSLGPLLSKAGDTSDMRPGDLRLVATILDQEIPGLSIRPRAPQRRDAHLLVVHLHFAAGKPPQPDANSRESVKPDKRTKNGTEIEEMP